MLARAKTILALAVEAAQAQVKDLSQIKTKQSRLQRKKWQKNVPVQRLRRDNLEKFAMTF
jgi:hypothetical protein